MNPFIPHLLQIGTLAGVPIFFTLLAVLTRRHNARGISAAKYAQLTEYIDSPAQTNDLFSKTCSPRTQNRILTYIRARLRSNRNLALLALALATLTALATLAPDFPPFLWSGPYLALALAVAAIPFANVWMRWKDVQARALSEISRR